MGLLDWSLENQKEALELMLEYAGIFAMHYMGLSKMSPVKHSIKHMDNIPFKVFYRCIPPSMYNEV